MSAAGVSLPELLQKLHLEAPETHARAQRIATALQAASPHLQEANFNAIGETDLARLFALYDEHFFDGLLRALLVQQQAPLTFRLSTTMTSAGGKTTRLTPRRPPPGQPVTPKYDIAISMPLLYQSFGQVDREVRVCGVACANRLQALQRIFEHELIHLLEMLVTQRSSCKRQPFKTLVRNLFGHLESHHDMVTQREVAQKTHDLRVGARVSFVWEGETFVGVINRITRRATVLVESPEGQRYTNGKYYKKFYVPLGMLTKV